jgi:hypothetical protein
LWASRYHHALLLVLLRFLSQAKATRDQMDGTVVDGRALVVRLRSERGQQTERRERPPPAEDDSKLYVAGLTKTVQEHALRELFGK